MNKKRLWLTGIALAIVGVIIARAVAPRVAGTGLQVAAYLAGILVAVGGLVVLMYGLRRKS